MLNPYKVPESVFRKDGKAKISILIVLGFLILHLVVSGLCIQFIYPPLNSYLRYGSGDAAEVVRDFRNYGYFVDSILSLLVCIFATCSVTITSMAMLLKERVVSYCCRKSRYSDSKYISVSIVWIKGPANIGKFYFSYGDVGFSFFDTKI